jgi:hypothetical protein
MKKNDVLKKLCLEEKIVLKHARLILLSFILGVFFTAGIFAQVPINGFCQYEKFSVEDNLTNIFILNFNKDSYTDIALFNPADKKVVIYKGSSTDKISEPILNKLQFNISALHQIKTTGQNNYFVFASRKERRIGLIEINVNGKIKIRSSIQVNCYPENISCADINNDGVDEILVSGSSYEGLTLFSVNNGNLVETSIISKVNFSSAVFVDLNNDNLPDIAAIDLMSNSIKFFYNNSMGGFSQVREIKFADKISNLKTYDFNLDNYNDLLFTRGNEIDVLTGDNVSSYSNVIQIPVKRKPYKFIIADFNSDGYNDISYIDDSRKMVSVIFSKEGKSFFNEILYLNKNLITDLVPYYSKFIKGFAAVGGNSNLYFVSTIKIIQDKTNISLGVEPDKIHYFDAGNDKIYDFYFLSSAEPYLNLIIRNNAGIPYLFYPIKLLDKYSDVEIDDKLPNKKVFYCYSKYKKLIEIITLNIDMKKYDKEKLYSSGPIFDLKISRENNDDKAKILVAYHRANHLRVQVFNFRDFRYTVASSQDVADNTIDAKIVPGFPMDIFYWQDNDKVYSFTKVQLNTDLKPNFYNYKFSVDKSKGYKIFSCIGDIFNRERSNSINFILSQDKRFAIITTEKRNYRINLQGPARDLLINKESDLFLGEYKFNGLNKLFVYNKLSEDLEQLEIVNKRNQILATRLVDSKNLSSYFIKNLNFKKYYLVYTDKAEKCITIRELAD